VTSAGSPLSDWLARLETFSPHEIELGLDRVLDVLSRMQLECPERVIHVAGTNGKGSSVVMLRSLLASTGSIATYMSPHMLRYNERICIDGSSASDDEIVAAFERVDAARGDVPLTYFEFGTLAAMAVFEARDVDTVVLEVGMGGRLDAVNAIEPDAGLITNVSLDHCEWLGNDVEAIGFEKAGIMRPGKPIVFADRQVPASVLRSAQEKDARLICAGRDYRWTPPEAGRWDWFGQSGEIRGLRVPALAGPVQVQNAAGVLAVVESLGLYDLLQPEVIDAAFTDLRLSGRMQSLRFEQEWLFDVAHNPAAAAALADALRDRGQSTVAIVGMLDDKDVEGVVGELDRCVSRWIATDVDSPRGIGASELARRIANHSNRPCLVAESHAEAVENAREFAGADGRILVTGSFYLVGPMLEHLGYRD
jgi:dihydrofolate synthase/folylpolyglutamate synthase